MIQFRRQRYRDLLQGCLLPFELQIFLGELVFSSGLDNDHPLSSHLALHTLKQDPVSGSKFKNYCEGFWMSQGRPHLTAELVRGHRGPGFSSQWILRLLDWLKSFAQVGERQLLSATITGIPMCWLTFLWGDLKKYLFTPDREHVPDLSYNNFLWS